VSVDHTIHLRKASGAAIASAMTTAGYTSRVMANPDQDQALPYVLIGPATQVPRHNKTHDGTTSTALFTAWATTEDAAYALAGVVLTRLTDRSSAISVNASVKLITFDYDQIGPTIIEDHPAGKRFGVPVRLRYRTHE
jgi:hypothetical protein